MASLSRSRRKRNQKSLNEDDEADEEFWNQEAFQEKESDEDFETDTDVSDSFDSDFGDESDEEDDVGEEDKEETDEEEAGARKMRKQLKTGVRFVKSQNQATSAKTKSQRNEQAKADGEEGATQAKEEAAGEEEMKKAQRQSSKAEPRSVDGPSIANRRAQRTIVAETQARREEEKREEEIKKAAKPKRKKPQQPRSLTQDEIVEDAAYTEVKNQAWLEMFTQQEEDRKAKRQERQKRQKIEGPVVKVHSGRDGIRYELWQLESPLKLDAHRLVQPETPKPALCAITGRPAKYRDPVTGKPFADAASFKELRKERKRALVGESRQKPFRMRLLGDKVAPPFPCRWRKGKRGQAAKADNHQCGWGKDSEQRFHHRGSRGTTLSSDYMQWEKLDPDLEEGLPAG